MMSTSPISLKHIGHSHTLRVMSNDAWQFGEQRISIKGNPNFGDIRTLMIGVKNPSQDNMDVCAEVWFNELRLSDMDNEGGWAATLAVDTNVADFMNISATARQSTSGFGNIEEGPSERDKICLLYTSPSPRDQRGSRVPSWD